MGFVELAAGLAAAVQGLVVAGTDRALIGYAHLPDAVETPCAALIEWSVDYQQTFGQVGLTESVASLGVFTSRGDTVDGRVALDSLLSPAAGTGSVRAAIETDRTLGGACKTLIVERVRGSGRLYTIAGAFYLGATIDVRVWL